MNKPLRFLSILAILIFASSHSFAQDYDLEVDGIYYTYDTDKLTATVVAAPYQTPYSGNITIPATFTRGRFTFNVNAIDDNAFNSSKIESVTMLSDGENGVSSINGGAFNYCTYLKKVTFPSTLKTIGKSAFKNCSALPSIDIPSSVINIGNDAFSGCTALTNVKFPDVMSEKSIGDYAFDNCGITTLTLPRGLIQTGEYAFDHCKKLTKVHFPDDFGIISKGMFYGCTSLEEISFPSSLVGINSWAFSACPLKKVVIPKTMKAFLWDAFDSCKQLEEFIIEDGEEPLSCWFPVNLSALKTFYLGRNLDYDGDERKHLNPSKLTIGPKVTNLLDIFGDGITDITCYIEDPTSVTEYFSSKVKANAILKVPAASYDLYCNTKGWKDFFFIEKMAGQKPEVGTVCNIAVGNNELAFKVTNNDPMEVEVSAANEGNISGSVNIPKTVEIDGYTYSVTATRKWAFENCSGLTMVTIPNSVTTIGNCAFERCSSLASIIIPNSVTSIGDFAFNSCRNLASVTIPNSVTTIGYAAFAGCTSLTSVTIPNSVNSIGRGAFASCDLTSITVESGNTKYDSRDDCNAIIETETNMLVAGSMNTIIPNSVNCIGEGAFSGCSSLNSVTIPNSVNSIGKGAFSGCSSLNFVTIPNSVNSIGEGAFYKCIGLTTVTIGNSVSSIGKETFRGCSALTTVTIGNSVSSIGENAFAQCRSLTSVTIPNSVSSIEKWAFLECSGLTSVTIGNSVTTIGYAAFADCSRLSSVTIGNSLIAINEYAFAACSDLKDVYCYAEKVPDTNGNTFEQSPIGDATLHVPASSINDYKNTAPWSGFGKIVALKDGDPSDIEAIENEQQPNADAPVYNLNGLRVSKAAKGIYIKNGRKVLVK